MVVVWETYYFKLLILTHKNWAIENFKYKIISKFSNFKWGLNNYPKNMIGHFFIIDILISNFKLNWMTVVRNKTSVVI